AFARLRSNWGWFVVIGIVLLVLGVLAFANLVIATVASVYFVGAMMLVGGAIQIVLAFRTRGWGRFALWLLGGILYALAGIVAFVDPLLASLALTLILAVSLIAVGVLRLWIGFEARPESGWGWIVAAGVVTLLTGIVIAIGWPVSGLWVLGLILAIDLIIQGWSHIAFGLALRRRA